MAAQVSTLEAVLPNHDRRADQRHRVPSSDLGQNHRRGQGEVQQRVEVLREGAEAPREGLGPWPGVQRSDGNADWK